jgi:hypothetical protein
MSGEDVDSGCQSLSMIEEQDRARRNSMTLRLLVRAILGQKFGWLEPQAKTVQTFSGLLMDSS